MRIISNLLRIFLKKIVDFLVVFFSDLSLVKSNVIIVT